MPVLAIIWLHTRRAHICDRERPDGTCNLFDIFNFHFNKMNFHCCDANVTYMLNIYLFSVIWNRVRMRIIHIRRAVDIIFVWCNSCAQKKRSKKCDQYYGFYFAANNYKARAFYLVALHVIIYKQINWIVNNSNSEERGSCCNTHQVFCR